MRSLLQGLLESKEEIGCSHAFFFRDNQETTILKSARIQSDVWHFLSNF